ncbi:hypothetical protein ACTXGL_09845 [Psychrobacter sp. T6-6]|uniref:VgrG-related protein n=1 Tax=Psychrobacter sp. T6-6 TaxID=3457452 RepID=UPI003FD1A37D
MTYLNYDAGGFIVGVNKMNEGIDRVHDDTQEIIQILKSQNQIANTRMTELTRAVKASVYQANSQTRVNNNRDRTERSRTSSSQTRITGEPASVTRRAPSSTQRAQSGRETQSNSSTQNIGSQTRSAGRNQGGNQASDDAIPISRDSANANSRTRTSNGNTDVSGRERDANGRFIGGGDSRSSTAGKNGGFGSLGVGRSDTTGIDPLVDSFREAKDLLSPLGRAGKLATRGAKFSLSKLKAMKRREPLPNDQDRHNNENEKLLDKILKAIRKQRGGAGGGLLGGLLGGSGRGGGLKKLFKSMGGLKGLGVIGALAGTAGLAMDWDNLDHQGKSEGVGKLAGAGAGAIAGAIAGSVVPVVGTVVGAVVGGWLGSEGGEWLGGVASPYIESWTSAITAYNLPAKMSDTWDNGIKPFFDRMDALAGKMSAWLDKKASDIGDAVSSTGAGLSEALGLADLGSVSEKYESGGRGVDTVSTGAGDHGGVSYGTHQLSSKTGTMAAYLKSPEGKKFAGEFAGLSAGSAAFNKRYKDVASRRSDEFEKSQKDYITRTHYMPAKKIAEGYGFDTSNRGIQEAIYSHSTQYGANHKSRFKRVSESGVDMTDNEAVLKALYADKARYVDSDFKSSNANVRDGVRNRIKSEQADVLAIAKVSDVKNVVKDAVTQKQPESKEVEGSLASKAKNNSSALGVQLGKMTPDKSAAGVSGNFSDNTPMIFDASKPAGKDLGYAPANFPTSPMLSVPNMPKIKQRVDSGGADKPIMIQSSNDGINQNVSDRSLAHAITGGLGQQRQWG